MSNNLAKVSISTGENPADAVRNGIEKLGGISQFVGKDDSVFIKINLTTPTGFPSNVNLDTLVEVMQLCKNAGAKNIRVGSFPFERYSVYRVSEELGFEEFIKHNNGEFVYLDNSDKLGTGKLSEEEMAQLQQDSFQEIELNDSTILYPKSILNADKVICINQVNVHPLFTIQTSMLNIFSSVHSKFRKVSHKEEPGKSYLTSDKYKKDLVEKIFGVFNVKKPDLVINDLFFLMEGAGPFIYKDSKINQTNLVVSGDEAIATDSVTLKILGLEPIKNPIISYAHEKNIGISKISNIELLGEKIENNIIGFKPCAKRLEDINLRKFNIKKGSVCSGCFQQAYMLLNFVKTLMVKDLNYMPNCSLLIGDSPLEPEENDDIIIFGDCTINSTLNRDFRLIRKEVKKKEKKKKKGKKKKEKKEKKKKKEKKDKEPVYKKNKKILELPGCPPNIFDNFKQLLKYFKKSKLPTLNLYYNQIKKVIKTNN